MKIVIILQDATIKNQDIDNTDLQKLAKEILVSVQGSLPKTPQRRKVK